MPRLLKIMIPYVVAALGAVAIFVSGAYAGMWFMGRGIAPRFGMQELSGLATDYALLQSLDAGNVDQARAVLMSQEDLRLMTLDMLAPALSDDLAKSTCQIMQKVAKQRADNAAKYSGTESATDPEVRQMVAASLQNPAACGRAIDKEIPPKRD
jgi:hypothetical protein